MIFPVIMLFLDLIYFSILHRKIQIKINYFAAAIAYIFVLFSYYYFIYLPKKSAKYAFVFGITVYGIYETTNWAIKNWPMWLVITDTLWGGILYYLTTIISKEFKY